MGTGPMSMIYRVNAGPIPADSWIQDKEIGGGRIIGEVCHFIDLLTFINGSFPVSVFASTMKDPRSLDDTVNINLCFQNGSIGAISYFANGSKVVDKEKLEIHRAGATGFIRDFKEIDICGNKRVRRKLLIQDKGQKHMVRKFVDVIKAGRPAPIPFEDIYVASLATFKAIESLRTGRVQNIER